MHSPRNTSLRRDFSKRLRACSLFPIPCSLFLAPLTTAWAGGILPICTLSGVFYIPASGDWLFYGLDCDSFSFCGPSCRGLFFPSTIRHNRMGECGNGRRG